MITEPEDFLGIDDWRERKMREKGLYKDDRWPSGWWIYVGIVISLGCIAGWLW